MPGAFFYLVNIHHSNGARMSDTNGGKPDTGMRNGNDPAMAEVRQNIDSIDKQLVDLLNQRAKWALRAGEVKKAGICLPMLRKGSRRC
jgi:hypothetical protein